MLESTAAIFRGQVSIEAEYLSQNLAVLLSNPYILSTGL